MAKDKNLNGHFTKIISGHEDDPKNWVETFYPGQSYAEMLFLQTITAKAALKQGLEGAKMMGEDPELIKLIEKELS